VALELAKAATIWFSSCPLCTAVSLTLIGLCLVNFL